jgi:Holliday junction resolvase-like predicted endonuclease
LKELIVTKAGGQQVVFSEEKLRTSMRNSGATEDLIDSVLAELLPQLHDGISTRKIYRLAFNKLKNRSKTIASRYKLKQAIMELGPDGFIFEKIVARILQQKGYHTKVGSIVQGKCITHEIDVIATTDSEQLLVECKYHSLQGKISDVKIPLYIRSRFEDVKQNWMTYPELKSKELNCLIVTNTRFSPDALTYGRCIGLDLLGWDYPIGKGIKNLIDQFGLYPITCLNSLTKAEKNQLLEKGMLFCSDIQENQDILNQSAMKDSRIKNLLREVQNLTVN